MRSADAIVVGGGIMGAATALFLRRRGRSVILVERGLVGQQASGVNFGNVRRQGRHLHQLPLANRSRVIWGRLPELLGEDCEFIPAGQMRVCYNGEQADRVAQYARDAAAYGLDLEILSGDAARARFPYLSGEVVAASYAPEDGSANPRLVAPAFGRAAGRLGATVLENSEVLGLGKAGEDFAVEVTGHGELRAPNLVITAGAWAARMSDQFGETVPLTALGPQMAVTEPLPYRIGPVVSVSTPDSRDIIYLRQVTRGNIVYGGGHRPSACIDTNRAYVLPENTLAQFQRLTRLVPALRGVNIIRVWSGIESYLPDDIPVLGPSSTTSGLYYAFGFCGAGFQLGPGVGDVLAELVDTGATSTPIAPYSIARFQRQSEAPATVGA